MIRQIIIFTLDEKDLKKAEEITFNGVIDGKIATGDYIDKKDIARFLRMIIDG